MTIFLKKRSRAAETDRIPPTSPTHAAWADPPRSAETARRRAPALLRSPTSGPVLSCPVPPTGVRVPVRPASLLLPGCLLALAATACSGSSPAVTVSPAATGLPAGTAGSTPTGSSSATATGATSATATHASTPPATAPGASGATAATTACSSSRLSVHEVSQQAATGHDQLVVALDNTGSTTCTLTGYPGLQLLSGSGTPLPTTEHRGASYTFPQAPVTTVSVAPGAAASFDIGYDEIPQGGNDVCEQAAAVAVTPPNGGPALRLAVSINACQHGELDASPVVSGSHGVS